MRIECPECSATYDVASATRQRRARCKACGATLVLEAVGAPAAAPTEPTRGPREHRPGERLGREKPPLLKSAIAVATASFLIGLVTFGLSVLVTLGTLALVADEEADVGEAKAALVILVFQSAIVVCLVVGGIGLLLRRSWGWWLATLMYGFFLLLNLKLMTPLLRINWGHPRAMRAAAPYLLENGIPVLVSIPMLVLLFRSSMRLAYGLKQRELVRHRTAGVPRRPR